MYPYIQACSDDHSDTVKASPHSNVCAIAAVLLGRNERNSHKHSCFDFIFSQASGTCKLQQLCLWEFLSF